MATMDSLEWPINRPVSAHLTIHYTEGSGQDATGAQGKTAGQDSGEHRVVRTVLNIDTDSLRTREEDGDEHEDDGAQVTPLGSAGSSRRSSGSHSAHSAHYQYGACCCRPDFGNNQFIARRFSEPKIPQVAEEMGAGPGPGPGPFIRSSSFGTGTEGGPGSSEEHGCLQLSCPSQKYHPRRNSIAVKFHKASYKKT